MAESEGREGREGPAEASAMPEGFRAAGPAAGAAYGEGMPVLPAERESAAGLDLLAELDEPESLMARLKRFAEGRLQSERWARWQIVVQACTDVAKAFDELNKPKSRSE